jgi:lysophospholipase L1-like esterase
MRDSLCIIVLGDSIAVGVPVEGDGRWWARLERLLATALPGRTIEVDNWAVSGSQVDVLESAARDQPAVGTYDIAIVIEGVNDEHVLTAAAWQPRYEAAIAMLESKGLTVIVTAPPPSYENGVFGTRYDPFAQAVRDVASRGRPLLDIAGRWHAAGATLAGTYYVDAIHQGAQGQVLMATMARDLVFEALGTTALALGLTALAPATSGDRLPADR